MKWVLTLLILGMLVYATHVAQLTGDWFTLIPPVMNVGVWGWALITGMAD